MLRPATPLAVLLFAAFGLLLMSVLSVPIIKAIPLGEYVGVTFGVFGYCKGSACSKFEIGYDEGLSTVLTDTDSSTFDLPSSTRRTLSTILIVHPVAAFITLVQFILAIVAHFHSPSHSIRYLLIVFIVGILNMVVCLLAFLIDVLLFVPHMAWGSYLVLAATILVALSGLVSCAMRRTLVSRKTRKKRIEENAEMSGENFYNRQAEQQRLGNVSTVESKQPTVPVLSGANGTGVDKLPTFASFDKKDDRSSDERVPLTAQSPSSRSPNGQFNDPMGPGDTMYNVAPPRPSRSPSNPMQRDQYGNPIEPADGYGMRRGPSFERMNSRGRGGGPPGGYRGRGGYGPPGRSGYGYGPPGRGGYGPPGRGGYGPPPGRGGYGPPPRGYGPPMRGRPTPPPPGYQYERRGSPADAYGPPGSAPGGYGVNNASMPNLGSGYNAYNGPSDRDSDLPRAESPPPLPGVDDIQGQGLPRTAAEMDGASGSPQSAPGGFGQFRDSDADIAGMVGLQQGIGMPNPGRHDTYLSDNSRYSQDEGQYVPPRQAWNNSPSVPSPLNVQKTPPRSGSKSSSRSPPPAAQEPVTGRDVGSTYYEDIDPRFAEPSPRRTSPPPPLQTDLGNNAIQQQQEDHDDDVVNPMAFGGYSNNNASGNLMPPRSPAESERSNFTSISQRGINPRWQPPPPGLMPGFSQGPPPRRPVNRADVLLNNNPDFELPGGPSARGTPVRGLGAGGGGAYPTGPL